MTPRQTVPGQWLIVDRRPDKELWRAIRTLAAGSGVLVLAALTPEDRRRLRHVAMPRGFVVAFGKSGAAARIHNVHELRQALLRRTPFILISPIYETRSHPDWPRLPRMRAAALARLAGREAIALGGMTRQRYAKVAPLGFIGWAGISAFRT